jgi:hypothetical protein
MKLTLLVLLSVCFFGYATAQVPAHRTDYKLLKGNGFVQSKNYYLLTLLQELKPARQLLEQDEALANLLKIKRDSIANAPATCSADRFCYTRRMRFTDNEIALVSQKLTALYKPDNALGKLVSEHLIPSGCYILFQKLTPAEMLVKAWEQDARGVNFAIGVYAEGKKPNYPNIDSIGYNVNNRAYVGFLKTATETIGAEIKPNTLFFEPSLTAALRFIEVNDREQAADFEPMAETVNRPTLDRIKKLDWTTQKYTVLLVLGSGPQDYLTAISGDAMMRLRMAATQFRAGLAPIMVVSGGKVHPHKTRFCEAEEMKRYLVEKLNIPANAILIDPHARHTTTNIRNTARLLFRYGIPTDKPAVVSSASSHIASVMSDGFDKRCMNELKLMPFRKGNRLTATEAEFYPLADALHINPTEPMDP